MSIEYQIIKKRNNSRVNETMNTNSTRFFALLFLFILYSLNAKSQEIDPFKIIVKDTVDIFPDDNKTVVQYLTEYGDSIYYRLHEGTYYNSEVWGCNRNNIIIEGIGKVKVLCTDYNSNVIFINGSHIKLKNLYVKHEKPSIEGLTYCTGKVIYIYDSEYIIIEDCDINGCGVAGIHSQENKGNIIIKNCHIHNNSLGAFTTGQGLVWVDSLGEYPDFTFIGNLVENNGHGRYYNKTVDYMKDGTIFIYPNFSLQIKEFYPEELFIEENKDNKKTYNFKGDNNMAEIQWEDFFHYPYGLRAKNDSLILKEDYDNILNENLMILTPNDSNNSFIISYKYEVLVYEVVDYKTTKITDDYQFETWNYYSSYQILDDSITNIYNFPMSVFDKNQHEMMIDNLELKDTSFVIPCEYSTFNQHFKNGKFFCIEIQSICLKIEQFVNGELVDPKYLKIWFSEDYD